MDDMMRRRVMMGPMPYFTVAQGLHGLEGGLMTGLPGFSVFIVNPPMMFGMIQGDQTIQACYGRNFSSEWVPPPCPQKFSRETSYNIYRMFRYIFSPYSSEEREDDWNMLRLRKYVLPYTKEEESDEVVIQSLYAHS